MPGEKLTAGISQEAELRGLLADDLSRWGSFATGLRSLRPETSFLLAGGRVELLGAHLDEARGEVALLVATAADRLTATPGTFLASFANRLSLCSDGNDARTSRTRLLVTEEERDIGLGIIHLFMAGATTAVEHIVRVFEDESCTRVLRDLQIGPGESVEGILVFEL